MIDVSEAVFHHHAMRSMYPGERVPCLPRIFKNLHIGLEFKEINPGHTQSVLRGYEKRVSNFKGNRPQI
jgi:hypothetical protein